MKTFVCCIALAGSLTFQAAAESSTTNILDGVTTNAAGSYTLGDTGPLNFLLITNGGRLTNTTGAIGNDASANENLVVVAGAGSRWDSISTLSVGVNGSSNRLSILDSGWVTSGSGQLGVSNSSWGNLVLLAGAGSAWETTGPTVGAEGSWNRMEITGGAWVTGLRGGVGQRTNASHNLASVTGIGSAWTNSGRFQVGDRGSFNRMVVSNGGHFYVIGGPAVIGDNASGRSNLVGVTGSDSRWRSDELLIGASGSFNQLVASDGAHLNSASSDIGQNCLARDNLAFITGSGTVWSNGLLQIGFCSTNNHLVVSNGAQVFAGLVWSSVQGGASNTMTVTGPGSLLRATSDIIIGNSGTANSLLIADGGQVQAREIRSGSQFGGFDNITITGRDSLLRASGNLAVGSGGASNIFIASEGARVEGNNDWIGGGGSGLAARTFASAFVANAGTSWSNQSLTVGRGGLGWPGGSSNRLIYSDGARLDSGDVTLGWTEHALANVVRIFGNGTVWNIRTNLIVGWWGSSNLFTITEGGRAGAQDVVIGLGAGGGWGRANQIIIENSSSVLNVSNKLTVGQKGPFNRLLIRDGGRVNSSISVIGAQAGSGSNSVLITGAGAVWNNSGDLVLGSNSANAELTIADGGKVSSGFSYVGSAGETAFDGTVFSYVQGRNRILVTDPQSLWRINGPLNLGHGSVSNSLVVSNAGTVIASHVTIGLTNGGRVATCCPGGFAFESNVNHAVVKGGCLVVTNASQTGTLEPRYGTLVLLSGIVVADRLVRTNSDLSRIELNGGTFRIGGGRVRDGSPLVVGDGIHGAELHLAPAIPNHGMLNFDFSAGVLVQSNAVLIGEGAVAGPITNRGTLSPGDQRGGSLGLGQLFLEPGSVLHFDISGTGPGANHDYLGSSFGLQLQGRLQIRLRDGFIPASSNVFRVIGVPALISGNFNNVPLGGRLKTTDNLGSFLVVTNGNFLVLRDYQSTDLDGDGIEDAWATNAIGHSPLTPVEKLTDADGDGASNYDEFKAGTDPNDPASALGLSIAYTGDRTTVSFPCVDGKEYHIWSSNNLERWTEVTDPTFAYPSPGRCEWADDGKDTGGLGAPSRFYRVTVD